MPVTIEVTHPILGIQTLTIDVKQSDFAFTTSPVISGVVGEDVTIGATNDDVILVTVLIQSILH